MSDAAVEDRYEQDLRRCKDEGHPRLFFFQVGNAEVAVCPRCEVRFIQDVTAGDGSEWDQQVRETQREVEATVERHPAGSASGTISCCQPRMLKTPPGGSYFAHSRFCPEQPGIRVDVALYAKGRGGEPWRGRRLRG